MPTSIRRRRYIPKPRVAQRTLGNGTSESQNPNGVLPAVEKWNGPSHCETPLGFASYEAPQPRVRFATLGFDVERLRRYLRWLG